jgi:hypothetical protein
MDSNTGFIFRESQRKNEEKPPHPALSPGRRGEGWGENLEGGIAVDRKKMEEAVLAKAKDGKLPCALCFKLAEEFGNKEMGKVLNEMKVKISQCQLGCFE